MPEEHKIKYYNSAKQLATITLKEGKKWSDCKTSNAALNSLFNFYTVDDGDGIISQDEINYIKIYLKDKNKNGIFEQQELESAYNEMNTNVGSDVLAKRLKDDICAKTKYGLPTTGEYLGAHLKDVEAYKVIDVLSEYKDIAKQSLFSAIMSEYGLDIDKRVGYCKDLFNKLKDDAASQNVDKKLIQAYEKEFNAEIERQKNSKLPADGKKLTEITDRFINEILKKSEYITSGCLTTILNRDICEKKIGIIPTTGKQFKEHVDKITKDNVEEVLDDYKENYQKSLFSAIMEERGLKFNTRADYCRKVFNQLILKAKNKEVYTADIEKRFNKEIDYQKNTWSKADSERLDLIVKELRRRISVGPRPVGETSSNGHIDDFKQGNFGTCWLLASLKALSLSPKGAQIIKESVKENPDGTVTVTLKGVGKSYTFSKEEIDGNSHLSLGDLEARAIEMAFTSYYEEQRFDKDIEGGSLCQATELLVGRTAEMKRQITPQDIEKFNDPNHVIYVSAHDSGNDIKVKEFSAECVDGSVGIIHKNHAYAVRGADKDNVYLINPGDSSKAIKLPIKEFLNYFNTISTIDL